jgi:hypothetical protein
MKKLVITIMWLALAGISQAQVVSDFEVIRMNLMLGGALDQSSMTVVPNPDPTGINTSNWVVKFIRDKDGVPYGGFWSVLPTPVDLTINKFIHVKIWKPRITPLKFTLEGGPAGNLEVYSMYPQTTIGEWEDMVFNFSALTGMYTRIAFKPDFENPLTLTNDIVIYFDDIMINDDPTPNSAAVEVIEDYEIIPLNLILGNPLLDSSKMTVVPNPYPQGFNVSNYVVEFVRDKDGVPDGGFWSPTGVDVTTNKYMHAKVLKPRISPIKFKIEGGAAGDLETLSMHPQAYVWEWEDMVFDFTSKTGTYPTIAFKPDFEDPLSLTNDIVIYFDDIILNNDSTPMDNALQVIMNVDMHEAGLYPGQPVYISGSFGGIYGIWSEPGTNPTDEMTDPDNDTVYSITMLLPAGHYQFKFFKGTGWMGGEWLGDPNRDIYIENDTTASFIWGELFTGQDEYPFMIKIAVYPVPCTRYLIIHTPVDLTSAILTSSVGKQIISLQDLHAGTTSISTAALTPGLYFITLYPVSGNTVTLKIVKQ